MTSTLYRLRADVIGLCDDFIGIRSKVNLTFDLNRVLILSFRVPVRVFFGSSLIGLPDQDVELVIARWTARKTAPEK
jgi:hypothetical protein